MKKLLNISVIAALAILPMAANAAVTDAVPGPTVEGDTATAATATTDPKYGLAQAHETDANLATAGYVKGAYNAAIKAINKVSETADGAVQSVTEGSTNGAILVDGTPVAVHGLGSAAYTASTDYISSAAGAVKTANIDDGQVTKEKLATAVQTSLDGAVQGVTLNGNALTETDGVVNVTAVQTVTTGTTNGTILVDETPVSVYGLGSAAYTPSTDYATAEQGAKAVAAETNIGTMNNLTTTDKTSLVGAINEVKSSALTSSALTDYAKKSGVTQTISNSSVTVPVMATWGSTTATTVAGSITGATYAEPAAEPANP